MFMKIAKKLTIIYENCDTITLPMTCIPFFDLHICGIDGNDLHNIYCADKVSLTVDLLQVNKKYYKDLIERKDITYLELEYSKKDKMVIQVAYPCYFDSWRSNPYQDNSVDKEPNLHYYNLGIDIEKYISLLSIKQAIVDYFKFMFYNFPDGLRMLLYDYWETFKRFFKVKH